MCVRGKAEHARTIALISCSFVSFSTEEKEERRKKKGGKGNNTYVSIVLFFSLPLTVPRSRSIKRGIDKRRRLGEGSVVCLFSLAI